VLFETMFPTISEAINRRGISVGGLLKVMTPSASLLCSSRAPASCRWRKDHARALAQSVHGPDRGSAIVIRDVGSVTETAPEPIFSASDQASDLARQFGVIRVRRHLDSGVYRGIVVRAARPDPIR